MGRGLAAFAAGLGSGYLAADRQAKQDALTAEDRAMRKQEFDARMDEANRVKTDRMALADATRPAVVNENAVTLDASGKPVVYEDAGVANSDYRQARTMGLADVQAPKQTASVNGTAYGTLGEADAAAVAHNLPAARNARLADAYRATGRPGEAIQLENSIATQERGKRQDTQAQEDYARKLKSEGVFEASRAFRAGDAAGAAKIFNSNGQYKLDGDPVMTREDKEIPGVGTVPTYTAKVRMIGPDGKVTEKSYNSHDVSMALLPYEKQLELQRKGTDTDSKIDKRLGDVENARLKLEAAAEKANSNGQPTREERLRYTSLFSDAGRRLAEANKALSTLQRDPLFSRKATKEGTPEFQQVQELRDTIKSHSEERALYQGLLAGSQSGMTLKPSGPGIPTEAAAKAAVNSGMGRDPAAVEREIAQTTKDLAKVTDQPSKILLQNHLADLQGKRGSPAAAAAAARPTQPGAKPNYSSLWN